MNRRVFVTLLLAACAVAAPGQDQLPDPWPAFSPLFDASERGITWHRADDGILHGAAVATVRSSGETRTILTYLLVDPTDTRLSGSVLLDSPGTLPVRSLRVLRVGDRSTPAFASVAEDGGAIEFRLLDPSQSIDRLPEPDWSATLPPQVRVVDWASYGGSGPQGIVVAAKGERFGTLSSFVLFSEEPGHPFHTTDRDVGTVAVTVLNGQVYAAWKESDEAGRALLLVGAGSTGENGMVESFRILTEVAFGWRLGLHRPRRRAKMRRGTRQRAVAANDNTRRGQGRRALPA